MKKNRKDVLFYHVFLSLPVIFLILDCSRILKRGEKEKKKKRSGINCIKIRYAIYKAKKTLILERNTGSLWSSQRMC